MIVLCALAFAPGSQAGKGIRVSVEAQPLRVTVGDVITCTVRVTAAPGVEVELPGLRADLSPFEIRDYEESKERGDSSGSVVTGVYKLAVFEVGRHDIPSIEVKWRRTDGERGSEATKPVSITVASVLPKTVEDIKDIKGPREVQPGHLAEVIVGIAAAAAVAIVLILGIAARRRAPARKEEPAVPPPPPDVLALQRLDALAESSLLAEGRVKRYYTELSDILREYVEGRYGVPALERTTQELMGDLRAEETGERMTEALSSVLSECDHVKFAKWRPSDDDAEDALAQAVAIVEATRPATVEPGGDAAGEATRT